MTAVHVTVAGTEFWLCTEMLSEVMPAADSSLNKPQFTKMPLVPTLSSARALYLACWE